MPTKASPLSLVVGALVDLITVAAVPADPEIKDSSAAYPGRSCKVSDRSCITEPISSAVLACVPVVELNGPTVPWVLTKRIQ